MPEVGGRLIVVVDDNEDNIIVLQHLLRRIGYEEVHCFMDPEIVVSECEKKGLTPDLFLLDVMMPRLSGIELARHIKASEKLSQGSIIFVTAREIDSTLEQCFEVGGVDFVAKPVSLIELRCRLVRVFELQDIQRRLLIQNEELRVSTLTDPLTGLFNRRYLDRRLDEECSKSDRYQHELSFLMLDLDFFKRVNDELGHPVGDRVLRQLSEILVEAVRSTDMVSRYGGEEFSIMLTGTPLDHALETAERIRKQVEDAIFLPESTQGDVTISIGVASYRECRGGATRLVAAADLALYKAKSSGRNKVVSFDGDLNEL